MRFPKAAEVVVAGGGFAGTLVAETLRSQGIDALLLEAGPRLRAGQKAPEVDRRQWPFTSEGPAFDWYRVRALGGRAALWGGWAYRFPDGVLRRGGFPFRAAEVEPLYEELEAAYGLRSGLVDARYAKLGRELGLRVLPKRALLRGRGPFHPATLGAARRARVDAVAHRLDHEGRSARALSVWDLRRERAHSVQARAFVLAASPIETTRILLESGLDGGGRVGEGLTDHMVASYVLVEPAPPPPAKGRGRFPGAALVESFVNVDEASARGYRGGFSVELVGPVPLEELGLERMVPSSELATTRATMLHALGEVFPDPCRRVSLDPTRRDALGRPAPRIAFGHTPEDRARAKDMKNACKSLADALAIPGSRLIPFVDPLQAGAGHEAGTAAMGLDEASVCEPHGRLRALDNLWLADASAMPTAGDRHPTLTLLVHARRVADDVARHLLRG